MSNIHRSENSYVIDQESAAEMARLLHQDKLTTRCMGSLFPGDLDLTSIHDVLDIACGPGGWAQEVAFAHRDKNVVGIDISTSMLVHAQSQANIQGLSNASFLLMDATSPLKFPDNSFDMVNARFLIGFMWKGAWPELVAECMRITRPGGLIRLIETDNIGLGNSAGYEKLNRIFMKALHRTGRTFNPYEDSGNLGITPMLRHFLVRAGCESVFEQPYMLNFSFGADEHDAFCRDIQAGLRLAEPFMHKLGLITEEDFDQTYRQMLAEMEDSNFCAIWSFMSASGYKPA